MGQYRERLLQKHAEVAQQVQRHQQEHLVLINLVSKYGDGGATVQDGSHRGPS